MQLAKYLLKQTAIKSTQESYFSENNVFSAFEFTTAIMPEHAGIVPGLKSTVSISVKDGKLLSSSDFVPQGIAVAGDYVLITAYDHTKASYSVMYVIDKKTRRYITTFITDTTSHVGGVAYDSRNKYVWIASGSSVLGMPYADIVNAAAVSAADPIVTAFKITEFPKTFKTLTTASYLTFFDNLLWAGKFNETDNDNIYGYYIDLIRNEITPKYIIEAPVKAQGMTFYKPGKDVFLAVSTSFGRNNKSTLRLYKTSYDSPQAVEGATYKRIKKNTAYKTPIFPPMSEGIAESDGLFYILFESAAKEYRGGIDKDSSNRDRMDKYIVMKSELLFK